MAPDRDKAKDQLGEAGTMARRRILVVEDEIAVAEHVRGALASRGYDALAAIASGEEAVDRVGEIRPDLVLMDIRLMGEMDGVEAAEQIRARFDVPVVYLTALADEMTLQRARVSQPFGYILKPFRVDDLHSTIEMALYKHEIDRKLRKSEERLRTFFAVCPDCIYLTDTEGRILDANPVLLELTGLSLEELREKSTWDFYAGGDPERLSEAAARLRTGEEVRGLEAQTKALSGEVRDYEVHAVPLREGGEVTAFFHIARDVTGRKRTEAALRGLAHDLDDRVKELSCLYSISRLVETQDISLEALLQGTADLIPPACQHPEIACVCIVLGDQEFKTENFRETAWRQTGDIWVRGERAGAVEVCYLEERPGSDGQPFSKEERDLIDAIAERLGRIVERVQTEEALRESEETARILLNAFTDIVALIDTKGFILVANEAIARRFGRHVDELVGTCGWDLVQADLAERRKAYADQVVRSGEPVRFEDDRQGMWFDNVFYPVFDVRGRVTKIAVLARDITERKRMEAQIQEHAEHLERLVAEKVREAEEEHAKAIHSARLAALGQMATGVAHELNQPLTAMQLEADYLKTVAQRIEEQAGAPSPDVDGQRSEFAEELRQIGKGLTGDIARCRRLIDHLRAFGRASRGHPTSVDLNKSVEGCFILVGERLREHGVVVEGRLAPDLPPVLADANRLEQVFLNLIGNAEDALEEMERRVEAGEVECPGYQKRLEISTYVSSTPPAGGAGGGRWVVVEVRDNGCGIVEADRERVFEPFFTTKPVGEGTGLGLSIGYGIVTEYGGEITFESAENEGTAFTVRFPVAGET